MLKVIFMFIHQYLSISVNSLKLISHAILLPRTIKCFVSLEPAGPVEMIKPRTITNTIVHIEHYIYLPGYAQWRFH